MALSKNREIALNGAPQGRDLPLVALSKNRVFALGGAKSAAKCALLKRNAKRTRATTPGIGIFGCAYFPGDSWASSSARFHAAFAAGV